VKQASLGRIIAGFVYLDDQDVEWHRTICKMVRRSTSSFMGEPMFVIELKNGEQREVIGEQLRPWFPVTDTGDDWLYFQR
jgi:hypothetical protein